MNEKMCSSCEATTLIHEKGNILGEKSKNPAIISYVTTHHVCEQRSGEDVWWLASSGLRTQVSFSYTRWFTAAD